MIFTLAEAQSPKIAILASQFCISQKNSLLIL